MIWMLKNYLNIKIRKTKTKKQNCTSSWFKDRSEQKTQFFFFFFFFCAGLYFPYFPFPCQCTNTFGEPMNSHCILAKMIEHRPSQWSNINRQMYTVRTSSIIYSDHTLWSISCSMEFSYIWGRWSCFQVRKVMFAFDKEIYMMLLNIY
jgi:hypothetical protein